MGMVKDRIVDFPPPKKRISLTDASVLSRLTEPKLNIIVQQILKGVDELIEFYNQANSNEKFAFIRNIRECYIEECKIARRVLATDEFIQIMVNSIGWDFAFPDSPVEND